MSITLRLQKGTALTNKELDDNFVFLDGKINDLQLGLTDVQDNLIQDLQASLTEGLNDKQDAHPRLQEISSSSGVGFLTINGSGVNVRTLTPGSPNITIVNNNGVAGNPTIDIGIGVVTTTGSQTITNKIIDGRFNTITNVSFSQAAIDVLPIANGGTAATSPASARASLSALRDPAGQGFVVKTATDTTVTRQIQVSGLGLSVTNPAGEGNTVINSNATTSNTGGALVVRDSSGNFSAGTITANLIGRATVATTVDNGVVTTGVYNNPSWITNLSGSKVTNIPNSSLQNQGIFVNGTLIPLGGTISLSGTATAEGTSENTPNKLVKRDGSGNFSAGTITANLNGQATTVANGVYTNAIYNNPSWITGLAGSKVSNIPNSSLENSAISINNFAVALGQAITLPYADTTKLYNNPSWITGLAGSKVTNIPNSSLSNAFITINGVDVQLGGSTTVEIQPAEGTPNNTPNTLVRRNNLGDFSARRIIAEYFDGEAKSVTNGVYSNSAYNNPSWIANLNGSKLIANSVPNTALQNSSIRINGTNVPLGGTIDLPTGTSQGGSPTANTVGGVTAMGSVEPAVNLPFNNVPYTTQSVTLIGGFTASTTVIITLPNHRVPPSTWLGSRWSGITIGTSTPTSGNPIPQGTYLYGILDSNRISVSGFNAGSIQGGGSGTLNCSVEALSNLTYSSNIAAIVENLETSYIYSGVRYDHVQVFFSNPRPNSNYGVIVSSEFIHTVYDKTPTSFKIRFAMIRFYQAGLGGILGGASTGTYLGYGDGSVTGIYGGGASTGYVSVLPDRFSFIVIG